MSRDGFGAQVADDATSPFAIGIINPDFDPAGAALRVGGRRNEFDDASHRVVPRADGQRNGLFVVKVVCLFLWDGENDQQWIELDDINDHGIVG